MIHLHERGTHHLNHARGQHLGNIAQQNAGGAGRAHRAELMGGPARQEIAHELGRRRIIPAAEAESRLLNLSLVVHPGQWMRARKMLRLNADEDRGIRILPISRPLAHTVYHHAALLARRAHNRAARAHAEGVHPPAVRRMARKLIICRAERRMARKPPVLRAVNERLRVLNARADRKGLLHHLNPLPIERLHRIPRGVANGENHRIGFEIHLAPLRITVSNAVHRAVGGDHTQQPAGE